MPKKKKKPNEHWTVKRNIMDLRFIEKDIWKASIPKNKPKKKKKLKIIANKFNNHSSIQQSKHYKLPNKTTTKIHTKNSIKIHSLQSQKWAYKIVAQNIEILYFLFLLTFYYDVMHNSIVIVIFLKKKNIYSFINQILQLKK